MMSAATVDMVTPVASFAEAWIEILNCRQEAITHLSPPSRRRGLKCLLCIAAINPYMVASFAEAWIEMTILSNHNQEALIVASFAEAWIEIYLKCFLLTLSSRLLRGGVD